MPGDFFFSQGGIDDPINEPPTPPPDFEAIGRSFGLGIDTSGLAGSWLSGLYEILVKVFTTAIGILLSLAIRIFAWFIGILGDVSAEASTAYGTLVAATLKELFGIDVDPNSVNTRRGGADRQAVATKLGQTIIGTFFTGTQTDPNGRIVPSSTAADNFLATTMNMELNGWIESWFADGVTGHLLEKYGDLKDGIAQVLGLGRLSRQVFAPPLKVLVHDPYLALLEEKYRPKPVAEATLMRQFYRGEFTRESLSITLGRQGYSEQYIDWVIQEHEKFLSLDDVNYLLSRGTWTNDDAAHYLQEQGHTFAGAQRVVEIINDKRIHKYRTEIVSVAEAAFVKGDIPFDQWQSIASTSGLTDEEITWTLKVAGIKRELTVTHLSLGQIETGIKDGIMNLDDLRAWATRVNMPFEDETFLELMVLFDESKQTKAAKAKADAAKAKAEADKAKLDAAAGKAAVAKAQASDKGVSVSEAETLVRDGLWTFDHLRTFLTAREYGPDAIDAIVALLHDEMAKAKSNATAATGARATAAAKGLTLAQTEKAVVDGILTLDDLGKYLVAHQFGPDDVRVIVAQTQDAQQQAAVKAAARARAEAKAAAKQISLGDLERAVRAGLTTLDTYQAALADAGFDAASITLLTGLLDKQIAADQAAAAKSGAGAGGITSRGVTLAQLEQEVIAGVRPIGEYRAELIVLGYTSQDADDLTKLVQLKIDQAKATAAAKSGAGAQLAARNISLAQAERAVKLGIIPISEYRSLLVADGFQAHAVDVLANTLLAEVAKVSSAQQAANAAAGVLARQAISLPQLEQAVIQGLRPIDDYVITLQAAGYSAADVTTLQDLLQLKVDQRVAAELAHADAEGNAAQKGISLAAAEQAVIQGINSMDSYDALLTSLGYDAIDRGTLEALLQAKVTAAAAKAGTAVNPNDGAGGSGAV